MIYGSVCSGVEAASVAWHDLGWNPSFFAEVEPFPCKVLSERFGASRPLKPLDPSESGLSEKEIKQRNNWIKAYSDMPQEGSIINAGDFTKIQGDEYAAIDLLVGGTPCQDFSNAGKRAGWLGKRGSLTGAYVSLIERLRPTWFIWENVPGALNKGMRRGFFQFTQALSDIGYCSAWRVLDAQYVRVDGYPRAVPQRRRRIFLVGYLGDWRPPAAVLFEQESLLGDSPPCRTKGKRTAGTLTGCTRESGGIGLTNQEIFSQKGDSLITEDDYHAGFLPSQGKKAQGVGYEEELSPTLRAGCTDYGLLSFNPQAGKKEKSSLSIRDNLASTVIAAYPQAIAEHDTITISTGNTNANGKPYSEDGVSRTVTASLDQAVVTTENEDSSITDEQEVFQEKADCLYAAYGTKWNGNAAAYNGSLFIKQKTNVRRLTPVECERLQGFPDNWTRIPWRGKKEDNCPDGPRYKAMGNSMAVNCMRWLGQRIDMVDKMMKEK